MRLGPDEAGVDQVQLGETLDTLETYGQELTRLERGRDPRCRRLQVALALAAKLQQTLLGQLVRDVHFGLNALQARIQRILIDEHSALAAQTKYNSQHELMDALTLKWYMRLGNYTLAGWTT